MKTVSADPIFHRDEYTAAVEKEILTWMIEVLFTPIRDLLAPFRRNEEAPYKKKEHSAIWDALMFGVIWYADGIFSGTFNAAISRELRAIGARKVAAGFAIAQGEIPIVLRGIVTESAMRAEEIHRTIITTLDAMETHIAEAPTGLVFSNTVDSVVDDLQEQLVQSVSKVEGLSTPGPIPPDMKESLRESLATEANLEVKGFSVE